MQTVLHISRIAFSENNSTVTFNIRCKSCTNLTQLILQMGSRFFTGALYRKRLSERNNMRLKPSCKKIFKITLAKRR